MKCLWVELDCLVVLANGAIIQNLGIGEKSTIEGMDQTGALVGYMKGGLVQYCIMKDY